MADKFITQKSKDFAILDKRIGEELNNALMGSEYRVYNHTPYGIEKSIFIPQR